MSEFSQSDLQNLWIQAGGDPQLATTMSAIAMAESNGNSEAKNPSSGACGLWQIFPPQANCGNPLSNAQMAVQKYNTQGLSAWETWTNGAWKRFFGATSGPTQTESQSSQQNCLTFTALNVCWDGVIGLGAIIVGIGLMIGAVSVLMLTSDEGKQVIKVTGEAAQVAIVAAPK